MSKPNSREELIEYCLRRLGSPVIEINVDEDQLDDRIDDALQFYQEYHSDAVSRVYLKHQISAIDIQNGYLSINDNILFVRRILPISATNSSVNMFDARYQIALNDMYDLGFTGSLAYYDQVNSYMSMLDMKLNGSSEMITK